LSTDSPLWQIMHPRSIAWVGASNNPTKMGTIQLLGLKHMNFPGPVYPIHPEERTVLGLKAYASAADLPEAPDLAVLIVPTRFAVPILEDLGKRGVKRAVIVTAGFKEMGEEGRRQEQDLVATAKRYGIRFVGPNCIGVIHTRERLNTTFFAAHQTPGSVGIASQSGTYVTQVQLYLRRRGIAFSQAISVGNEANIDVVDCLEYLAEEEDTRSIILYLESLRRPHRFLEVARRVTREKPVMVLYVGGTQAGARSGMSHTGSLAGDDRLYNALFRQAGILRVSSIGDLYTFGFALANQPALKGNRVGIVSHSGGPVTSIADACERCGLEVPVFSPSLQKKLEKSLPATASGANPVDLTFSLDPQTMAVDIPRMILESGEVDGVIIHGIMGSAFRDVIAGQMKGFLDIPMEAMADAEEKTLSELVTVAGQSNKPVVCSSFMDRNQDNCTRYLQDHGVPVLYGPEKAVRAMAYLRQYGRIAQRPQ
jgi:acetate---CoA ligase (ADP-forming)